MGKDGRIYQTASVKMRCYHVGRLIKSRCLQLKGSQCKDADLATAMTLSWAARIRAIDRIERQKDYPERFPVNSDSIGIELVGRHLDDTRFEALSAQQVDSLQWLLGQLYGHFELDGDDVFRHPDVSYKHPGEAASATW
ncbi:peptidoglycan recognition protein family protein [Nitrogeniibacter aestuarii]|uniref:peptidoglycan recognition protein family protein n=1 Tax=Nitrogeniibacter aestuarii TaxID=2815343 RepID=UPI002AB17D46|nr:N-acetylmuramoyl-L-alanine amidase [Nitrogeniibacter aestuarii]